MVFVSSKKYACETCIKGHRSSACKHTDRPLFEIKKKGRPVTQCEHCRELRKTKQVHVKCLCESKIERTGGHTPPKKGSTVVPECATFPNGLPQALEASVAVQPMEGVSSDSDHGGGHSSCNCSSGDDCHCCTPRKSAPRIRLKRGSATQSASLDDGEHNKYPTTGAEAPHHLRPVLPRPSITGEASRSYHNPSSGTPIRHHDDILYSPYGRAYEQNHPTYQLYRSSDESLHTKSSFPINENALKNQMSLFSSEPASWTQQALSTESVSNNMSSFPSACTCDDTCHCLGCSNGGSDDPSMPMTMGTCSDPSTCPTCFDCFLAFPTPMPPNTALSIPDYSEPDVIDDWLRQVSSLPAASCLPSQGPDDNMFGLGDEQFIAPPWNSEYASGGDEAAFGRQQSPGNDNDFTFTRALMETPRRQIGIPELSRSRSSSASSNSSPRHAVDHMYKAANRMQGLFGNANAVRSVPELKMKKASLSPMRRSSPSMSSPGALEVTYAGSNADSEGSFDEVHSHYDPSMDGLQIH